MATTPDPIIVFDLGGVLIDWNPRHLYRKLFDEEEAMERFLAQVCTPAWNLEQDRGRSFAEACALLAQEHPEHEPLIHAYRERWIEMIGGPIEGTARLLEQLHDGGHRLVALTNWSAETLPLVRHDPTYGFFSRFDEVFVSGELRLVKPDAAIFHHMLERLGARPEQCWFIDDSAANIETARSIGFNTHRFTEPEGLAAWLRETGLLAGGARGN